MVFMGDDASDILIANTSANNALLALQNALSGKNKDSIPANIYSLMLTAASAPITSLPDSNKGKAAALTRFNTAAKEQWSIYGVKAQPVAQSVPVLPSVNVPTGQGISVTPEYYPGAYVPGQNAPTFNPTITPSLDTATVSKGLNISPLLLIAAGGAAVYFLTRRKTV